MRARKRLGQHFLEPAWARKVVALVDPRPDDLFLEIGPGTGALTLPLAARARSVVAIEVDRFLAARLSPRLPANARVVAADILSTDLADLNALFPLPFPGPVRVAGNLPYNIASPILFALIAAHASHGRLLDATLMLQREVADRLTAEPGVKDYGVLTVAVALAARVRPLLELPPGAFRPPPAVTSALVRLEFLPASERPQAPTWFDPMVRSVFTQRRKTIGNALARFAAARGKDAKAALRECGIDARRRPETLSVDELLRVARALA